MADAKAGSVRLLFSPGSLTRHIQVALAVVLLYAGTPVVAQEKVLFVDYRERPPEMIVDSKTGLGSGPLMAILDEAADKIGYKIRWRSAPFPRSLKDLRSGVVDIVPRVIVTEGRKPFVAYLGPIGYQDKDIVFLVRKGQEASIKNYDDLRRVKVGIKRDAAYFQRFNEDKTIDKVVSLDDANMAKMFAASRFDTMIVLDVPAIEKALHVIGFTDYAYAEYKYVQHIGNYYGMSKMSPRIGVYPDLNAALEEMRESGRVREIYVKYGAVPPSTK
jgi:polar amino acid transport system substrate-binding protein